MQELKSEKELKCLMICSCNSGELCGMKTAIGIYKQALFGLDHLQFEDIT